MLDGWVMAHTHTATHWNILQHTATMEEEESLADTV